MLWKETVIKIAEHNNILKIYNDIEKKFKANKYINLLIYSLISNDEYKLQIGNKFLHVRVLIHHSEVAGQTSHVRTKILLLISTVQVDWSFPYFLYNCSICTGVMGFQQELSFQVFYCMVFESLVVLERKCPVTSNM